MNGVTTLAAVAFALLAAGVVVFQMALVLGAPWGELTLGGRWRGRLPLHLRVLPLVSVLVLSAFLAVVLARAGLAFPGMQQQATLYIWIVVGYCALGIVANIATPSRKERLVWLPVVSSMAAAGTLVALS